MVVRVRVRVYTLGVYFRSREQSPDPPSQFQHPVFAAAGTPPPKPDVTSQGPRASS